MPHELHFVAYSKRSYIQCQDFTIVKSVISLSKCSMSLIRYGLHDGEQYTKWDLTKVRYKRFLAIGDRQVKVRRRV